jgi:hypothetical protein
MEREIIERLAIDRTLGELDADTVALLDAYLAEHDEARQWVQAMEQTCRQTRDAVVQKTQSVAPYRQLSLSSSRGPRGISWQTWGRWAAVILVSVGIGVTAGRWSRTPVSSTETVVVQAQSPEAGGGWRQLMSRPGRGFWETKAVAMMQVEPSETPRVRATQQGLWDRYRQSRKEWSYE